MKASVGKPFNRLYENDTLETVIGGPFTLFCVENTMFHAWPPGGSVLKSSVQGHAWVPLCTWGIFPL